MAKCEPDEIIQAVQKHADETDALRVRMEEDYELYTLSEYDAGDGFQSYTSNAPQVYADKVVGWIANHEIIIRMPYNNGHEIDRLRFDAKEKFLIGLFRANDERLTELLLPSAQQQMCWYISIRGWYAARSLLMKDSDGETYVDFTPWDPLHTFWSMGSKGLNWACYRIRKTRSEIESEYPDFKLDDSYRSDGGFDEIGIDVYDYYDDEQNCVVIHGDFAKKPTPHGSDRVPVVIGAVGTQPPIQPRLMNKHNSMTASDYGESVFKSNRDLFGRNNFMMSVMLELVARSRKQGMLVRSRDGSKTLDEDPYQIGAEISLAEGEDISPLGLMEMARESSAFMGLVSGEIQRGSLPYSVYGELQFQLSGFAINTLRQGIETVIQPRLKALSNAYVQVCNLLSDQYESGSFKAMQLVGWNNNRNWFDELIEPEIISGIGAPEINLIGDLPQDDMTKMNMAQIARNGQMPLLPDRMIRDEILGLQNADEADAAIKEQMAEQMIPEAALWTILKATEERGRPDLSQFYFSQLMEILAQKQMMREQGMMPGGAGGPQQGAPPQGGPPQGAGPGGGGATQGLPPNVMPPAMMGIPPPLPTPQAGALVPPGSPRPGRLSTAERLSRLGLFPPGGG